MDKGIKGSGQGFDAASAGRLGSHSFIVQHNPSEGRLRDVMLQVGYSARSHGPPRIGQGRARNPRICWAIACKVAPVMILLIINLWTFVEES